VLLSVTKQYTGQRAVTPCGWESERMSGITLAMHHRLRAGFSTGQFSTTNKSSINVNLRGKTRPLVVYPYAKGSRPQ